MINLKDLAEQFEMVPEPQCFWFDRQTEEVIFINTMDPEEEDEELLNAVEEDSERYIALPSQFEIHEWQMMADFVDEIDDDSLQDRFSFAIHGRGAFRNFERLTYETNMEQAWYAFKREAYKEKARQWCEDNDIAYSE
jgi:hypothetical protein